VTARGLMDKPQLKELPWNGSDPSAAWLGTRNIFAENRNALVPAEIYDFERLQPGNTINGPAVIHTPITTIVIEDGQSGLMDGLRNIVIH